MKNTVHRLTPPLVCFLLVILILSLQTPLCYAQTIDPTGILSLSQYYQGDDGYVEVWIANNGTEQVGITLASVCFNWTGLSIFNLSLSDVVYVNSRDEICIGEINFTVPINTTVGYHSYYLYVEFDSPPGGEKHTWQTPEYTVWIEDSYKGLCDEIVPTVASKLTNAREAVANATSAIESLGDPQNQEASLLISQAQNKLEEAQTYLNQAENAYDAASTFYMSRTFQDAYSSLQECANAADNASTPAAEASSLAAQAQQKEIEQQQQQQQQEQQRKVQQMMLFVIPIAIVVAALIVIILIIKRR